VCAVLVGDTAKLVNTCDKGSNEKEINEGDKLCIGLRSMIAEEGEDCPSGAEDGDDKEEEDIGRGQGIVAGVDVYEVGEHAHCWDQSDNLHKAPKGEEDTEEHLGDLVKQQLPWKCCGCSRAV